MARPGAALLIHLEVTQQVGQFQPQAGGGPTAGSSGRGPAGVSAPCPPRSPPVPPSSPHLRLPWASLCQEAVAGQDMFRRAWGPNQTSTCGPRGRRGTEGSRKANAGRERGHQAEKEAHVLCRQALEIMSILAFVVMCKHFMKHCNWEVLKKLSEFLQQASRKRSASIHPVSLWPWTSPSGPWPPPTSSETHGPQPERLSATRRGHAG